MHLSLQLMFQFYFFSLVDFLKLIDSCDLFIITFVFKKNVNWKFQFQKLHEFVKLCLFQWFELGLTFQNFRYQTQQWVPWPAVTPGSFWTSTWTRRLSTAGLESYRPRKGTFSKSRNPVDQPYSEENERNELYDARVWILLLWVEKAAPNSRCIQKTPRYPPAGSIWTRRKLTRSKSQFLHWPMMRMSLKWRRGLYHCKFMYLLKNFC